jgi:glyoxylase-like metal-dependent hydrolase (beta-lactamase superfamily II)
MGPKEIIKGIYLIGGPDMTDPKDCLVYLIDLEELILIDTGAGDSVDRIVSNIKGLGYKPDRLSTIILTHCHIDHVGGAGEFRKRYNAKVVIHEKDSLAVEKGDKRLTGASWYGVDLKPLTVDVRLTKDEEWLSFKDKGLLCLYTPGHTPGSISVLIELEGQNVLFGQDIHGPFLPEFGADLSAWQESMKRLLALNPDILCEGHFGIFRPASKAREYIERYIDEYGD